MNTIFQFRVLQVTLVKMCWKLSLIDFCIILTDLFRSLAYISPKTVKECLPIIT